MVISNRRWSGLLCAAVLAACGTGSTASSASSGPQDAVASPQVESSTAALGKGAVLYVPSEQYPTITSALAAAQRGDVVRVAAGEYRECIVLKDGVTLAGPDRPLDEPPLATLDGNDACTPVVLGDASIVHGATVKGFRIVGSKARGIDLLGAQGVQLSAIRVNNPNGLPLIADHASFTLDHSTFRNCGGAGCVVLHASKGTLVENDIAGGQRGVIVDGGAPSTPYPDKSPSEAVLVHNTIHGNDMHGLSIGDRGSSVQAVGNVYERNVLANVYAGVGGTYRGVDETLRGAPPSAVNPPNVGVQAIGCELKCAAVPCNQNMTIVTEPSSVTLHKVDVAGNFYAGILAQCGADVGVSQGTFEEVTGFAAFGMACAAVCLDGPCTTQEPVLAPTGIRLDRVAITGSGNFGAVTACGARLDLHDSLLDGNAGGVVAVADMAFGNIGFHEPSTVRSRGTVFSGNGDWAVIGYDSYLDLGTVEDPGLNSFLANWASIANVSWYETFAQWNWFGTTDAAAIEATLGGYDLSLIHYTPFLTRPPAGHSTR